MADLPSARYGHACLLMEWAGAEGVLVSGGALTRDPYSSKLTNDLGIIFIYSQTVTELNFSFGSVRSGFVNFFRFHGSELEL